jgi:hypothetical protein
MGSYQSTSELMRLTRQKLAAAKRGRRIIVNARTNARTHSYQETTYDDGNVAQTRALEHEAQAIRIRGRCRAKEKKKRQNPAKNTVFGCSENGDVKSKQQDD